VLEIGRTFASAAAGKDVVQAMAQANFTVAPAAG